MPTDELDSLLSDETLKLEQFSSEVRAHMRLLMQEIERDFQQFIDRMLQEQTARLEAEAASLSPQGEAPAFGTAVSGGLADAAGTAFSGGGSILGDAFNAVLNAATSSLLRTGKLKPRAIANAGGRVIASQIDAASFRTSADTMRLSRAQLSERVMKELGRANKNS